MSKPNKRMEARANKNAIAWRLFDYPEVCPKCKSVDAWLKWAVYRDKITCVKCRYIIKLTPYPEAADK